MIEVCFLDTPIKNSEITVNDFFQILDAQSFRI